MSPAGTRFASRPVIYTDWRYSQLKKAQRTGKPLAEVCGYA